MHRRGWPATLTIYLQKGMYVWDQNTSAKEIMVPILTSLHYLDRFGLVERSIGEEFWGLLRSRTLLQLDVGVG